VTSAFTPELVSVPAMRLVAEGGGLEPGANSALRGAGFGIDLERIAFDLESERLSWALLQEN